MYEKFLLSIVLYLRILTNDNLSEMKIYKLKQGDIAFKITNGPRKVYISDH